MPIQGSRSAATGDQAMNGGCRILPMHVENASPKCVAARAREPVQIRQNEAAATGADRSKTQLLLQHDEWQLSHPAHACGERTSSPKFVVARARESVQTRQNEAVATGADRSTRPSHSCSVMNGSCRILPMHVENAPHLPSLWLPARASLCKLGNMRQ